jgi:membrane-associated protease RseP (regulator of RpoE activity)
LVSFFWGPIPSMIEVALVLSAILRHWAAMITVGVLLVFNAGVGSGSSAPPPTRWRRPRHSALARRQRPRHRSAGLAGSGRAPDPPAQTVSEAQEAGSPGATLPDVIQTSAAIHPGNSGGALADLAGQVVGIPTLAATDQQLGGAAPGIGFAIPSNIVTDIAGQISKTGHVTNSHRAAIGVSVQTVTGPDGQPAGAAIAALTPGGPAAKAGLQPGDVITAVNGTAIPDTEALAAVLAGLQPGQQVPLSVTRADGSTATVRVTLGQLPGS